MQGILVNIIVGVVVKLIEYYLERLTPEQQGKIIEALKPTANTGVESPVNPLPEP